LAYAPNFELYFEINETRIHYPSEHSLEGETFDAEFQVFGVDIRKQAFFCNDNLAALSVLLKVDDN